MKLLINPTIPERFGMGKKKSQNHDFGLEFPEFLPSHTEFPPLGSGGTSGRVGDTRGVTQTGRSPISGTGPWEWGRKRELRKAGMGTGGDGISREGTEPEGSARADSQNHGGLGVPKGTPDPKTPGVGWFGRVWGGWIQFWGEFSRFGGNFPSLG